MESLDKLKAKADALKSLSASAELLRQAYGDAAETTIKNLQQSLAKETIKNEKANVNNDGIVTNKYGLVLSPVSNPITGETSYKVNPKANNDIDWTKAELQAIDDKIEVMAKQSRLDPLKYVSEAAVQKELYANDENDGTIRHLSPAMIKDVQFRLDLINDAEDAKALEDEKAKLRRQLQSFNYNKALQAACIICKQTDFYHKQDNLYATLIKAYNIKQLIKNNKPAQYVSLNVSSRGGTGKSTDLKAWIFALGGAPLAVTASPMDFFKNPVHNTNIYSKAMLVCFEECTDVGKINTTACNPIIDNDGTYEYKKLYRDVVSLKSNCTIFGSSNVNIFKSTENDRRASITYYPEKFKYELDAKCKNDPTYYSKLFDEKVKAIQTLIKYGPDSLKDIQDIKPAYDKQENNKIAEDLMYFFTRTEAGSSLAGQTVSVGTLCRMMKKEGLIVQEEQLALHIYDNQKTYTEKYWSKDKNSDQDKLYSRFKLKDDLFCDRCEDSIESIIDNSVEVSNTIESYDDNLNAWIEEAAKYAD